MNSITKDRFAGIERLYGADAMKKLRQAHICIIGVGGVGSWAAEAIVRAGVGKITLVDLDDICVSNTNRQLQAMTSSVGKLKVQELKRRFQDIHPELEIRCVEDFFTESTLEEIFSTKYDYVLDAIDSVGNKCLLLNHCKKNSIPVFCVGGAGGKIDPTQIRVVDLNKSYNDALLAKVRSELRTKFAFPRGEKKFGIACVFSPEHTRVPEACEVEAKGSLDCEGSLGSITGVTGTFGFFAASYILNALAISVASPDAGTK